MPKAMMYNKGAIPYFIGDDDERIFILQNGLVMLESKDLETGELLKVKVHTGEFFGVKSALGHFPREETAKVLTDSTVIVLSPFEFENLFASNKELMMKMFHVFSKQLRLVHKKINNILNKIPEDQETGMFNVAKSFFADEQYRSCIDICKKILDHFPNSRYRLAATDLIKNAEINAETFKPQVEPEEFFSSYTDKIQKTFSSHLFSKFAKDYEVGQVIVSEYEPGDTFYFIQKGNVQLVKCVNGTKKNLDILQAGEFFGEMAILDDTPRSATCVAKTQVKCLEFKKENFESIITANPQIALKLLKLFCKRIYNQRRRFSILMIKDITARIADVFYLLYQMNPNSSVDGRSCKLNITFSDVAQWAGIPMEDARDEINKFVEHHRIEIYDNYIYVNNVMDMKRLVETRAPELVDK